MKHSYLLIGITFGNFVRILFRNGGISLRYLGRFLYLLQGSIWASVFALIEKIK